jgi:chorismate synthase
MPDVNIIAYVAEIGGDAIDRNNFEAAQIDKNPFFCPDEAAAGRWEKLVDEARKAGSSLGAVIECVATGVPAGWGAPLYAKLDSELASAMMSINAVKGVEIGAGFGAASTDPVASSGSAAGRGAGSASGPPGAGAAASPFAGPAQLRAHFSCRGY